MLEYKIADKSDKEDVIDFINYVFSHAHRPHDFKSLLPKAYGDNIDGLGAKHCIVKKDGKIKGVVAYRTAETVSYGKKLKIGMVGSVSVHPYSRGEGYMKSLMNMMADEAKKDGLDMLSLGGIRQRYGYFGFECAGSHFTFTVTRTNMSYYSKDIDSSAISFRKMSRDDTKALGRAKELYEKRAYHAVRKSEELFDILQSYNEVCRAIYKNDTMIGYICGFGKELILENESDMAAVLKALFEKEDIEEVNLKTEIFEKERTDFLMNICQDSRIEQVEMIRVLNWQNVLDAMLTLKANTVLLDDGVQDVVIADEPFRIKVENGEAFAEKTDAVSKDAPHYTAKEAINKIFGLKSLLNPDKRFHNWFPFPYVMDFPDLF